MSTFANSDAKFSKVSKCQISASVRVQRVKQELSIEGFDLIRDRCTVGQFLEGELFGDGGYKWQLRVYPHGVAEDSSEFVGITLFIARAPAGATKVSGVKFAFSLFGSDGTLLLNRSLCGPCDFNPLEQHGFGKPKWWRYVAAKNNRSLLVVCEVEFADEALKISTETTVASPRFDERVEMGELLDAIKGLRLDEQFADLTIIVVGERFRVHRNILASRSPVFKALFSDAWSGKDEVTMPLTEGESVEAVGAMLDFLYTGKCGGGIAEYSTDLIHLAEKYEVDGLKALCECRLCDDLGVENVGELYAVAKKFRLRHLEADCREFFDLNEEAIRKTREWAAFTAARPDLAVKLFESSKKRTLGK